MQSLLFILSIGHIAAPTPSTKIVSLIDHKRSISTRSRTRMFTQSIFLVWHRCPRLTVNLSQNDHLTIPLDSFTMYQAEEHGKQDDWVAKILVPRSFLMGSWYWFSVLILWLAPVWIGRKSWHRTDILQEVNLGHFFVDNFHIHHTILCHPD